VKLERALAVGQLRRLQGTPQEWPADAPAAYRPEAFRRFLDARLAPLAGVEVVATDCDEYPCVALLRSRSTAPDWLDQLMPVHDNLEAAGFGQGINVIGAASELQDDEDSAPTRLYAWGVAPGTVDGEVGERLKVRIQDTLKDAGEEYREESRQRE
jgi:hypothetical protein